MQRIQKLPLIIILGTTGVGKTKLSIELAQRFGGEIISADSMQVYKEFNIITAKATVEEQQKAKHHLLDVASVQCPYDVRQFRDAALPIIDRCLKLSRLPIVVGGTNYYIESILWKVLIDSTTSPTTITTTTTTSSSSSKIHDKKIIQLSDQANRILNRYRTNITDDDDDDNNQKDSVAKDQLLLKTTTIILTKSKYTPNKECIKNVLKYFSQILSTYLEYCKPTNDDHLINIDVQMKQILQRYFDILTKNILNNPMPVFINDPVIIKFIHLFDKMLITNEVDPIFITDADESTEHLLAVCQRIKTNVISHLIDNLNQCKYIDLLNKLLLNSKLMIDRGLNDLESQKDTRSINKMLTESFTFLNTISSSIKIQSIKRRHYDTDSDDTSDGGGDHTNEDIKNLNTSEVQDIFLSISNFNQYPTSFLYNILNILDNESASKLHPNNRRKIIRALEIQRDSGKSLSDTLRDQQSEEGSSEYGGPLRYEQSIIFWIKCSNTMLNERLDMRVDDMLKYGLLQEIRHFYNEHLKIDNLLTTDDTTKGILQSIGFKEFLPYLEKYDEKIDNLIFNYITATTRDEQSSKIINTIYYIELMKCVDSLKAVTKRYAKKQLTWITNRFLMENNRKRPPIYLLELNDVNKWNEEIYSIAENVINQYINKLPITVEPIKSIVNPRENLDKFKQFYCEQCERTFIGELQWDAHKISNKHKRTVSSKRKRKNATVSVSEEND